MAATNTMTADAVGDPEPIIVESRCLKVTVFPVNGVSWKLRRPLKTSPAVTLPPGERYSLTKLDWQTQAPFEPGDIAGFIETLSGSETFNKIEE